MNDSDKKNLPPGRVTIFGAGVTGLTVAHELIVRGFEVNVVEKHPCRQGMPDCLVGGMAATQWAYDLYPEKRPETLAALRAPAVDLSARLVFKEGCDEALEGSSADELRNLKDRIAEWRKRFPGQTLRIWIDGHAGWGAIERAQKRARDIAEQLGIDPLWIPEEGDKLGTVVVKYVAHTCPEQSIDDKGHIVKESPQWRRVVPRLDSPVPGEHGYRYFPGYYRHLFDTMRRTPIYDERGVETPHTVFENLVRTTRTAFSEPGHLLMVLARERLCSVEELRKHIEIMLRDLRFTWQDILRIQLKLLRYTTSCKQRREGYEAISWWDFFEGDKLSPAAQDHMLSTPQALVAMSAKHSDARVQGNTLVQLLIDQWGVEEGRGDMTLNGPTNEAWLDHWRRFLEYQGVKFYRGELQFFAEDSHGVIPVMTSENQKVLDCNAHEYESFFRGDHEPGKTPTFYVLATDVGSAKRAVGHLDPKAARRSSAEVEMSAVEMLQRYRLNRPDELPEITDPLRFMAGIQFYFDRRFDLFEGHIFYRKSPWGLTSISQAQFWRRRQVKSRDRYLTVLSVIIGRFDVEGYNGKIAWECTRDEIAREVWKQIQHSLDRTGKLPIPCAYHVDDNLIFNRKDRFTFRARQKKVNRDCREEWVNSNVGTVTLASSDADETPKPAYQGRRFWMTVNGAGAFDVGGGSIGFPYPRHGTGQIAQVDGRWVIKYQPIADFVGRDFFGSQKGVHTVEVREEERPVVRDTTVRLSSSVEDPDIGEFERVALDTLLEHPNPVEDIQYQIVAQPSEGELFDPPPKVRYRPNRRAPGDDRLGYNRTPFHTNPVGDYKNRPGWLPETDACEPSETPWSASLGFRHNLHKNLVLAGTYMKTFTRLTTMEAANESGRHAVNTILAEVTIQNDGHQVAEPCKIWDPEDHEVHDLAPLKLLDEALFDAGLPHFADILELDRLPDKIVDRDRHDLSLKPNMEHFSRLLRQRPRSLSEIGKRMGGFGDSDLGKILESLSHDYLKMLGELTPKTLDAGAFTSLSKNLMEWLQKLGKESTDK